MPDLGDTQRQAIETEIFAGRKIQAIKLHREATGVDLKTAKDAVEAMESQLRQSDPTRFKAAPSRGCAPVLLLAIVTVLLICYQLRGQHVIKNLPPFRDAIINDDVQQVEQLLKTEPPLIHAEMGDAASPLHLAARHDASNAAGALLNANADLYVRDDNGQLSLDIPPGQTLNATRKLLREVNKSRNEFLGAVGKRDTDRVKAMLAADPTLKASRDIGDGWSAVMMSSHFGDAATLKVLLDAGAVWGNDFSTWHDPMTVSVLEGKTECFKLLVASRRGPTGDWSVKYGQLPMRMNALHIACWKGHTEIVTLLLETKKLDPNARATSYAMFSPLHFAATEGHTEIIKLLLAAGADAKALDGRRGITPLQMAQAGKHDAAVEALSEK